MSYTGCDSSPLVVVKGMVWGIGWGVRDSYVLFHIEFVAPLSQLCHHFLVYKPYKSSEYLSLLLGHGDYSFPAYKTIF